jgi:2-oxo-4-hydroxy-4-carboxy-5-ureidoimidazoline decarboxylase
VNTTLAAWNAAGDSSALEAMLACCGSKRWAAAMVAMRPIASVEALSQAADRVWSTMQEPDWLEAFACHPRIGECKPAHAAAHVSEQSAAWSRQEQSSAGAANELVLTELAEDNQLYEQRRLARNREAELREAAEQQRQIMQIRLGKWLVE